MLYNSWEATGFDVDEASQMALAARAAAAGRGAVRRWTTAGSARARSDHAGLGDWTPDPGPLPATGSGRWPTRCTGWGCAFGIWVEPEMVNPDSDLYRAHPDWVLHIPDRARTELRNQLVLNFARDDVADWAYGWLTRLVAGPRHRLPQVGHEPRRSARPAGPAGRTARPAVDELRARPVRRHRPAARRPSRGCASRACCGRRRPGRPGHPRPYRPGVDRRTTPTPWTASRSSTATARSTRRAPWPPG